MRKTVVLIIVDGWGVGPQNESNAIFAVHPPTFERIAEEYPCTTLQASGIGVGLPWGEPGDSEVGHLTIGAGKVLYQYFPKITMSIQDGTFFDNAALREAADHVKESGGAIHFVGLLSKHNTHSSLDHLNALQKMAIDSGVDKIWLHLFADGIDSGPKTLPELLKRVPKERLATLSGRYYGMNSTQNWTVTSRVHECIMGAGSVVPNIETAIATFLSRNSSEDLIAPMRVNEGGAVKEGDSIVFFNFQEDGMRQLAESFADPKFAGFARNLPPNLHCVAMTRYSEKIDCPIAFIKDEATETLSRVVAKNGLTQLKLSETNRYAHLTYFFNGGTEAPLPNEFRVFLPSLNAIHPDDHPEMVAEGITERLIEAISNQAFDLVVTNYPNADAMAHTGNYPACLTAVKIIDKEIGKVLEAAEKAGATVIITSDHSNIDQALSEATGQVDTKHGTNPVPLYLVGKEFKGLKFINQANGRGDTSGMLADVAPTILDILGLPVPTEMTGDNLLRNILV